jgi:hypothetical protein
MSGRPGVLVENAEGLFISGGWVGAVGLLADTGPVGGRSADEAAAVLRDISGLAELEPSDYARGHRGNTFRQAEDQVSFQCASNHRFVGVSLENIGTTSVS